MLENGDTFIWGTFSARRRKVFILGEKWRYMPFLPSKVIFPSKYLIVLISRLLVFLYVGSILSIRSVGSLSAVVMAS